MSTMTDQVHLETTRTFIAQNPASVVLTRRPRIPTGTGGTTHGAPYTVGPYEVRLVGLTGQSLGTERRTTADGQVVTLSYVMIGMPDTDVESGDQFTDPTDPKRMLEVLTVQKSPPWRVHCEVFSHGVS